jgi:hypothetical protein
MRRTRTSSSRRGPSLKTDSRTSLFVSRRTARPSTRMRTWSRVSRRTGALLRWSSSGKWLSLPVCLPGPHSFPGSVARLGHIDRIVGRSHCASVGSTEASSDQSASVSSVRRLLTHVSKCVGGLLISRATYGDILNRKDYWVNAAKIVRTPSWATSCGVRPGGWSCGNTAWAAASPPAAPPGPAAPG